jgi:hypothetical protein
MALWQFITDIKPNTMKKLFLSSLSLMSIVGIYAQSTTVSGGGNATGSGGSVSYSIGQIAYTFASGGANGYAIQGVQQPLEVSVVTSVNQIETKFALDVYPNPTSSRLILNIGENNLKNMTYQLLSIDGTMLKQNQINSSAEQIDMSALPSGTYLLKILSRQQQLKLFKVIKTN